MNKFNKTPSFVEMIKNKLHYFPDARDFILKILALTRKKNQQITKRIIMKRASVNDSNYKQNLLEENACNPCDRAFCVNCVSSLHFYWKYREEQRIARRKLSK